MKKLIFIFVMAILVSGCATSGKLATTGNIKLTTAHPYSVSIKCDPNLSYWWGPWEPDLKDRVANEITRVLKKARISVVDKDADITILIKEIETGGWTGTIVIGKIILLGLQDDKEIFKITYTQHTEMFTLKGLLSPSKMEKEVARVLAKEIIKKLKTNNLRDGCTSSIIR